jgi:hypothetical protein
MELVEVMVVGTVPDFGTPKSRYIFWTNYSPRISRKVRHDYRLARCLVAVRGFARYTADGGGGGFGGLGGGGRTIARAFGGAIRTSVATSSATPKVKSVINARLRAYFAVTSPPLHSN